MKRIYVPSSSPADWQPLLSRPEPHWKAGFSAMSLARCWEAAGDDLPAEIAELVHSTHNPVFSDARLLLAIPEYCVPLPGGSTATQTDVFALVRGKGGLGVLAVEGKVDEELGSTVETRRLKGASDRLAYLHELLGLSESSTSALRYQLLHRTAAAVLLAQEFAANTAAMIVHSFSPTRMWHSDFEAFAHAMGGVIQERGLINAGERGGIQLYLGWAQGEQRFRGPLEPMVV